MGNQHNTHVILKLEKIHQTYIEPNKKLLERKFGFKIKFNKLFNKNSIEEKRAEITEHFKLSTNNKALKNQETQIERSLGTEQTELCALILASYNLTLLHEWTFAEHGSDESDSSYDKESLNDGVNSFLNVILEIYRMKEAEFSSEDIQEHINNKFNKKYISFKKKYEKYKLKYIILKNRKNTHGFERCLTDKSRWNLSELLSEEIPIQQGGNDETERNIF